MRARDFVTESADQSSIDEIIRSFVSSPVGQKYAKHDCKTVTRAFVQWADQNQIPTQVVTLAPPSAAFIKKNPRFQGKSGQGDGHIMPIVDGQAIDFTVRQFGANRPFEQPLITPVSNLPSVYGRFGYFTDRPEWFLGGKTHWIGPLNQIPAAIFNQDFGDEILEEGVLEGKIIRTYLWHGSRQKIPVLEPRQSVDTGGAAGSNQNAIYATSDPKVAIAMGLTTPGSDTGMFPNDPQMVLFSGKIRKGENVYLHKVPFNGPDGKPQFVQGGHSREFHSVPGVKGIEPTEIKAVPVNKYLKLIRKATPADWKLRKKYMKKGVAGDD